MDATKAPGANTDFNAASAINLDSRTWRREHAARVREKREQRERENAKVVGAAGSRIPGISRPAASSEDRSPSSSS
jgi:hypothetical protein